MSFVQVVEQDFFQVSVVLEVLEVLEVLDLVEQDPFLGQFFAEQPFLWSVWSPVHVTKNICYRFL